MKYLVLAALVGCSSPESADDRLAQVETENEIVCWSYACPGDRPGTMPQPIDEAVTCMNDALASGARARAAWSVANFALYTSDGTRVFTVDHQLEVFHIHTENGDPAQTTEEPACSGPVRVGPQICDYMTPTGQSGHVTALAWGGCP